LPRWKGRLLNKAGRLTLINSVLSSVVIHHMTVPTEQMGPMKDRQNPACIPVAGAESANGGHCLVNWKGILRPKRLGGLGIIDLSRFNKALRLQWQWKTWKAKDKPWTASSYPALKLNCNCFTLVLTSVLEMATEETSGPTSGSRGRHPRNSPRGYIY
jgi:hypothetical protein